MRTGYIFPNSTTKYQAL